MVVTVSLVALGILGIVATAQWRRGSWLRTGRWMVWNASPPFVIALPLVSGLVISLGFSFVWPVAVVATAPLAAGALLLMITSARRGSLRRLPRSLRPGAPSGDGSAAGAVSGLRLGFLQGRLRRGTRTVLERPRAPSQQPLRSSAALPDPTGPPP
ncbi:hypothetical protein BH20ACT24_BH20ACT24_01860 [soil metagenome]